MSSIIRFLNHSILRPLACLCNSLPRQGSKKLLLVFASFLLMTAALLTMPLVATMYGVAYADLTDGLA